MEEMIDLEGLTEEEKTLILSVIRRDEELRKEQDTRASQLRSEIHNLRLQSVIRDGDDLNKICARCHKPFGFIFNTGDVCSQCKFRVCGVCRESLLTGKWLCTLCYKQVQLKGLTGEWIQDNVNNEKRRQSQSGIDLVKASLRHSLSNDVGVIPPGMSDRTSETESHGGDSGHISGTSAENTPEHKSRHHSHLSIPSLVLTSTSAEEQQDREEEDDIDDLVASHKSIGSLRGSRGNLHSSLTDSRESLYSVYSDAGEINFGKIPATGEILFGLDYNYKTGALEIHIKQCKDIAPVDTKRNRSDPYVKTYLLPDKTRSGKRKTKIKKHTLSPTFDEVLRYVISKSEVENRALWVTVWHNDRFGRNDFLGEVMIPMDCYKFGDASLKWYPLQDRLEAPGAQPVSYKGDLVLSVKFVTAENLDNDGSRKGKSKKGKAPPRGELQVLVKEAKNLTAVRSNGSSDPFCKAYLLPEKNKSNKQKSAVVKRNCNPTWNHVFLFEDVSLEEMKDRSLELTVWDYDKITSNDFLGGVRLNIGTGVASGKTVEWMDARGEEIAIWQSSIDRPNCWNDGTIGLRATMGKSEIRK